MGTFTCFVSVHSVPTFFTSRSFERALIIEGLGEVSTATGNNLIQPPNRNTTTLSRIQGCTHLFERGLHTSHGA